MLKDLKEKIVHTDPFVLISIILGIGTVLIIMCIGYIQFGDVYKADITSDQALEKEIGPSFYSIEPAIKEEFIAPKVVKNEPIFRAAPLESTVPVPQQPIVEQNKNVVEKAQPVIAPAPAPQPVSEPAPEPQPEPISVAPIEEDLIADEVNAEDHVPEAYPIEEFYLAPPVFSGLTLVEGENAITVSFVDGENEYVIRKNMLTRNVYEDGSSDSFTTVVRGDVWSGSYVTAPASVNIFVVEGTQEVKILVDYCKLMPDRNIDARACNVVGKNLKVN